MPISADIYSQLRQPEPFNPLAELAQFEQLKTLQQQNKLGALAFGDRERASADQQRMRGIYGSGATGADLVNQLRTSGFNTEATGYEKSQSDLAQTAAQNSKLTADTSAKHFDTYKAMLGTVADPQQAAQFVTASYNDPVIGPMLQKMGPLEQGLQRLQEAASTPQGWAQWKANAAIGIEKMAEMAKVQNVNLGGTMQTQSVQPATGQVTPLASAPITQDANSIASNATASENNRRSVGASYAHAAAAREQAGATRDQAQATRDAANIQTGFKNEADLRKEFEGLSEVKNYKKAYPAFKAVSEAATRNTPQADINLIYGLAKLYDPDSVVREGEYATIANSQAIPEWLKGQAQRLVGGGKLTTETKKQILIEAKGRAEAYRGEVEKARASYQTIAVQRGMRPENVFQAMGDAPAGSAVAGKVMRFDAQGRPVD